MGSVSIENEYVLKVLLIFCWIGLSQCRSLTVSEDVPPCRNSFKVISSFEDGYVAIMKLVSETEIDDGWSAEVTFDHKFNVFKVNESTDMECSGMTCTFNNNDTNGKIYPGEAVPLVFEVKFSTGQHPRPMISNVKLDGNVMCNAP